MKKIIYTILILIIAIPLYSQYTRNKEAGSVNIDDLYQDFSTTELTAFSMLGITPQRITKPGSAKEIEAAILNMTALNKIVSGIAIEWSPYTTFFSNEYTGHKDYKNKRFYRNILLTAGTLNDTDGIKMAVGLKYIIIDDSDPLLDTVFLRDIEKLRLKYLTESSTSVFARKEFKNKIIIQIGNRIDTLKKGYFTSSLKDFIMDSVFIFIDQTTKQFIPPKDYLYNLAKLKIDSYLGEVLLDTAKRLEYEEILKVLDEMIINYITMLVNQSIFLDENNYVNESKKILDEFNKTNWNKSMLQIGIGHIMKSDDYTFGNLLGIRWSALLNGGFSLYSPKKNSSTNFGIQLAGMGNYNGIYNKERSDWDYSASGGVRLIFGWNRLRISTEGMYSAVRKKSLTDKYIRLTLGTEIKLGDDMWFEMALGCNGPVESFNKDAKLGSLFSFRYSWNSKPRYVMF